MRYWQLGPRIRLTRWRAWKWTLFVWVARRRTLYLNFEYNVDCDCGDCPECDR